MRIEQIKKSMLEYRDFYGCDIADTDRIEKATTKKELKAIIESHRRWMEMRLCDAHTH